LLFNFKGFDFYEVIYVDDVLGQEENFKAEFSNCRKNNVLAE
jgi:hypothetical protein